MSDSSGLVLVTAVIRMLDGVGGRRVGGGRQLVGDGRDLVVGQVVAEDREQRDVVNLGTPVG